MNPFSALKAWAIGSLPTYGLLAIACGFAFLAGYARGEDASDARNAATIAGMRATWAEQERARAEAVARAERAAREAQTAEAERMNALAVELSAARETLASSRRTFNKRMNDVAQAAASECRGVNADWVRLYNEALGLAGAGGGAAGAGGRSAGDDAHARSAGTVRTGIQQDALTLATPADVLAHARDYGAWCQSLRAQCAAQGKALERAE